MYGTSKGIDSSRIGRNAKTQAVSQECMPDMEYFDNQIAKNIQAIDMLTYLLNEDMFDYKESHAAIGRLYVRTVELKRERKRAKKQIKKQKEMLKKQDKKK